MVTSINPAFASAAGGQYVTLTGAGFSPVPEQNVLRAWHPSGPGLEADWGHDGVEHGPAPATRKLPRRRCENGHRRQQNRGERHRIDTVEGGGSRM